MRLFAFVVSSCAIKETVTDCVLEESKDTTNVFKSVVIDHYKDLDRKDKLECNSNQCTIFVGRGKWPGYVDLNED